MVTFVANIQANFGTLNLFKYFTLGMDVNSSPATSDKTFTVIPDDNLFPNKKIVVTGTNFDYDFGYPTSGTIKTAAFYSTTPNPDRLDYKIT